MGPVLGGRPLPTLPSAGEASVRPGSALFSSSPAQPQTLAPLQAKQVPFLDPVSQTVPATASLDRHGEGPLFLWAEEGRGGQGRAWFLEPPPLYEQCALFLSHPSKSFTKN